MNYPINRGYHNKITVIVPPTTDMALVFPFDHENKKFDKGFYSSFLTDGRASTEQIELFLKDAEEVFKKKIKWLRRLKAYLIFSFLSGIILMMTYSLILLSGIDDVDNYGYNDYNNQHNSQSHHTNHNTKNLRRKISHEHDIEEQVDVMFMGWIVLCFAALIWSIVYRCVKISSFKSARKGVQEVIDRHYLMFANSGLRWNLPLAFPHYIELWKDYRGQNFSQPPNNQKSNNSNPSNFNQIYSQLQNQNYRYPSLNQVAHQPTYLDFQSNGVSSPVLINQTQRGDTNTYVPPYPVNFVSNA